MDGLKRLLIELASDAGLADEYRDDPTGVMERFGLDDRAVRAMLDRDVEAVRELSGFSELRYDGVIKAHEPK